MSCTICDAKMQCRVDFWNGVKKIANPFYKPGEGMINLAAEAWDEEWDFLRGKQELYDDFFVLRTQQEAVKSILDHPPITKSKLIKQIRAILTK